MNYSQLSQLIQNYTQNYSTEFLAAIPEVVKLAENRIYQTVEVPSLRKNATLATSNGNPMVALPADFLSMFSIGISIGGSVSYLMERDVSFLREAFPSAAETGSPRFYARYTTSTLMLAPTPGAGISLIVHYAHEPESIVTAGTSWLGDNTEAVLFYGALVEAYTYMKGDADLLALYKGRYEEALGRLKVLGEGYAKRDDFRADLPRIAPT